jgi:PilZ domain-containing protein
MNNKRTAERVPIDHTVSLTVDGDPIPGRLVNLSSTGALFSFGGDERTMVDQSMLGLDGTFTIKPKGKPARLYTGELVRFYVRDGCSCVALRFWNKYKEIAE